MSIKQQLQEEYGKRCRTYKEFHPDGSTVAVETLEDYASCLLISPDNPMEPIPPLVSINGKDYWLKLYDADIDIAVYGLET